MLTDKAKENLAILAESRVEDDSKTVETGGHTNTLQTDLFAQNHTGNANLYDINEIFRMQNEFQHHIKDKSLKEGKNLKETDVGSIEFMRLHTLALLDEVTESLRELPWKPWKKNQTFDIEAYHEELADIQIFLFNLIIGQGLGIQRHLRTVKEKVQKNYQRQQEGY